MSNSQRGEQDAPKGPEKAPQGPQPPSRLGEVGYGPKRGGKAQGVHGRTEVRSCDAEAELAVVHFRFVLDDSSAAGHASLQGESLHCLRLFQSKQQCGGFLAPGASKLPRGLDGPPCREDSAS